MSQTDCGLITLSPCDDVIDGNPGHVVLLLRAWSLFIVVVGKLRHADGVESKSVSRRRENVGEVEQIGK